MRFNAVSSGLLRRLRRVARPRRTARARWTAPDIADAEAARSRRALGAEGAHCTRQVLGVGYHVSGQLGALQHGWLCGQHRLGGRFGGVIIEDVIEDMEHAIGEEDVLLEDAGRVYEKRVRSERGCELAALPCLQLGAVGKIGAVSDKVAAIDDMVVQHVGEFARGHVSERGTESLEGIVIRGENGEVVGGVEVVGDGSVGDGTTKGREIELGGGADNIDGRLEEGIDYMDDTAREGQVLEGAD